MVDQDDGELVEGDPEEAGGIGDARGLAVLAAGIGDSQKPCLGSSTRHAREISRPFWWLSELVQTCPTVAEILQSQSHL